MKFLYSAFAISLTFTVSVFSLPAAPRSPLPPFPERALNTWRFDNPLAWGGPLSPPLALTGTRVEEAGSGYALRVGGALGPVLNRFPLFQSDGRPNLTLRSGTVRLWFAPDWSSGSTGGKGPGSFARLIEVGEVSEKAAGWWSLYFDPAGDAIHFSAQADGVSADYLKAPIAWQAGEWHQVTLIYAEKFSALYLDGELATVGEGVSVAPEEQAVAASGFVLGGDGWGASLAEGQFDELTTLDHPAGGMEILANYKWLGPVLQLGPVTSAETEFNRARSAAAKASKELQAGPSEEGGAMRMMAMLSSPCGTNLCLGIEVVDQYAVLTLFNTLPGTNYQIFSRADLYDHSLTNSALNSAVLEQELVGVEDQNYTQTVIPMSGRPWLFFRARETDRDIPHLHISDVRPPVLPEPYVQVRGYSESALASLTWTVTNSTGTTNGRGYILQQHYDTQQYKLTTNWWQCFDVPLGPGFNRIVITAADREGTTNTTTLHYASVFAAGRAPPALVIDYPPADRQVAGTNFTLRGTLDNPTAAVFARFVVGGVTNRIAGLVERNGAFWIENLPLTPGTNALTLIATDAGGVAATNTLDVVGSAGSFSVEGIGGDGDLYKPVGVVGGTVASGYTVTVNGVVAEVFGGGTWQSNGVPIPRGGVAVFHAEAFPASGPVLVAELILDKPTRLFLSDVDREQVHAHDWTPCDFGSNASVNAIHLTNRLHWQHYGGGLGTVFTHSEPGCTDGQVISSDSVFTELWDAFGGYSNAGTGTPTPLPEPYAEHASVDTIVAIETPNGRREGHYLLHSESQMHIQSGGRSIARRRDVIRFDGGGLEYFVGQDPGNTNPVVPGLWSWEFTAVGPYVTDITTNVTVLDGKLGPDGRLYSAIPAGAEVDVGANVVRVTATDPIVGGTGYTELTTEITATDLLPNQNANVTLLYTDVRATLDFGTNIHTVADLTTNTVRLVFEVLSLNQHFTNDLTLVPSVLTNGIVLLKSSQAWVSLTDTNTLEYYLRGDVRGAHLLAAVSAYGSYSALFDLHETGDATSVFTSDYYALAMGFTNALDAAVTNSIIARLVRLGGSSVSNLLVETDVNSLLFETSDHSFQVQLASSPPFASTNVDFADATVSSTALSATNYLLYTYETGTNTFVLATDDELPDEDEFQSWFGVSFSASAFSLADASDGGELHTHFAQFQGPADVLEALAGNPDYHLVRGPDGKYYLGNSMNAPVALLGLAATPETLQTNCTGTVLGGALKGLAAGVKGFVWDSWYSLATQVSDLVITPVVDLGFDFYSIASGSMTVDNFLDSWGQKHKGLLSVQAKLAQYVLDQLAEPSGDFATFASGFYETGVDATTAELKHFGNGTREAFIAGGLLLSNLWNDLQNGCPERRAQIISRATFEIATFYVGIAKANQASHAAEAAKVSETELLVKLAQESTMPEVQAKAAALVAAGGARRWQSTPEFLQEVARRAEDKIGGTGGVPGTHKHSYAEELAKRYQRRYGPPGAGELFFEQSYLNGEHLGEKIPRAGSVRLDVVEGSVTVPIAVYDYKFGSAKFTEARKAKIRRHAGIQPSVPLLPIRP